MLHERPRDGVPGRTLQLANAAWLAAATGVPVACDFRTADVAAGGQGAPIAPIYHLARARASGLATPIAVLNLGGLANVTYWPGGEDLIAFDTGPANGMIDLLVQARGAGRFDDGGRLAAAGTVDEAVLRGLLAHPYFSAPAPKSLDRYDFPLTPLDGLGLEDAAATPHRLHRGDRAAGLRPDRRKSRGGDRLRRRGDAIPRSCGRWPSACPCRW